MAEELRIAIRYITINVPGLPSHSAQQVADDFAESELSRHFSYDQDFMHCPSERQREVRIWHKTTSQLQSFVTALYAYDNSPPGRRQTTPNVNNVVLVARVHLKRTPQKCSINTGSLKDGIRTMIYPLLM